jgi:hypothetical protein
VEGEGKNAYPSNGFSVSGTYIHTYNVDFCLDDLLSRLFVMLLVQPRCIYSTYFGPGTDVMIFKIFSRKIFVKKLAFFAQDKAKLCKDWIITSSPTTNSLSSSRRDGTSTRNLAYTNSSSSTD